jgi:sec-independent protein translocase protein TatB
MFDIGASELLLTVIVAIVVIGPKDLPRALRMAGGWLAKIRRVSGHFRSGIEEMIRQAEMEEMEKKWAEKNAAIMQQEAGADPTEPALPAPHSAPPLGELPSPEDLSHPEPVETLGHAARPEPANLTSPELPLASPKGQP